MLITPNDKNNNINIDTLDKIQNKAYTTTAESDYKIIIRYQDNNKSYIWKSDIKANSFGANLIQLNCELIETQP